MKEPLDGQKIESGEAEQISCESPEPGLRPGIVASCRENISIGSLRAFFFKLKDGLGVDPAIAKHIEEGCRSCDIRRKQLYATTPYLQGWLEPKFLAIEEMPPRPEPDLNWEAQGAKPDPVQPDISKPQASPELERSTADVCRKLASLLASPTPPFSIEMLEAFDQHLRTIEHPAERVALVGNIKRLCDSRWRRLPENLQALAETAAEQLFTALSGGHSRYSINEALSKAAGRDVRELPPELHNEEAERAFLVYMMGREWFLNAEGGSVWAMTARNEPTAGHVVLYFDLLKKVLHMGGSEIHGEGVPYKHV